MVLRLPEGPVPIRPPLAPDDPLFRPAVRRWARAVVRELAPRARPRPIEPALRPPRLLALFIDGLPHRVLVRAARDGRLRFLGALRDARGMREARCFSGMPSSTAAFQAGLFYGLDHPDVPAFGWLDRATGARIRLNQPRDAAAVERRIAAAAAGPGLFAGGASYLSILSGGARGHLSTAGAAAVLAGRRLPGPEPARLPAWAATHRQHVLPTAARILAEAALAVPDLAAFAARRRTVRHEGNFFLNRVLVGQLLAGATRAEALVDLVQGAPRIFLNFHAYDEMAHRRGTAAAERTLRELDQAIEAILAVAAACPDPPEPWIFTDHGQIDAVPFERLFGATLAEWLRGYGDAGPPPVPSPEVLTALGARPAAPPPGPLPRVIDAGNYAHVYLGLGGERPLDGAEVAERFPHVLARALSCPGVGMVALRARGGAIALAGGRPIDPARPGTLPKGTSSRAVAALLAELARSPSSGDLVVYGTWHGGSCVAFSWEFSSHGGPSPEETETFVLHPADVASDPSRVGHGADLHRILAARYAPRSEWPNPPDPS
jgi:hypothetical protein